MYTPDIAANITYLSRKFNNSHSPISHDVSRKWGLAINQYGFSIWKYIQLHSYGSFFCRGFRRMPMRCHCSKWIQDCRRRYTTPQLPWFLSRGSRSLSYLISVLWCLFIWRKIFLQNTALRGQLT